VSFSGLNRLPSAFYRLPSLGGMGRLPRSLWWLSLCRVLWPAARLNAAWRCDMTTPGPEHAQPLSWSDDDLAGMSAVTEKDRRRHGAAIFPTTLVCRAGAF